MGRLVETDPTSHAIVLVFTLSGFPIVVPMVLTLIFYASVVFLSLKETASDMSRAAIHCEVAFGTVMGVSLWAYNRQLEALLREALETPYILTNHAYIRQVESLLFPWIRSMLNSNGFSSILDSRDNLETSSRSDIVDDDSDDVSAEYNPPMTARVGFHCWPTNVLSNRNSLSSRHPIETPKMGQGSVNLKWVMGFPQFPNTRMSEGNPFNGQDAADLRRCRDAAGYSRPVPMDRIIFLRQRQRRRIVASKAVTSFSGNSRLGAVLQRIAQYIRDCNHERRPLPWPGCEGMLGRRWSLQMGGFVESEFRSWHEQIFSRLRASKARRLPKLQQLALLVGDLTTNVLLVLSVRAAWTVSHGPQVSSYLALIWSNTAVSHCAYLVKRVTERRYATHLKTFPIVFCEWIALTSIVVRVGAVIMFPMDIPDPLLYMYAQLVLHHGVVSAMSSHTFLKKYILARISAAAAVPCLCVFLGGLVDNRALDRVTVERISHRSKLHRFLRLRP